MRNPLRRFGDAEKAGADSEKGKRRKAFLQREKSKTARPDEVNILLNLDKRENEPADGEPP